MVKRKGLIGFVLPLLLQLAPHNQEIIYDKGHLCPAADMTYSFVTMRECFYMSSMSPQEPGFNRGIWKRLEEQVRDWAYKDSLIYVVTGGVLGEPMKTIGKNKVAIPKRFYKIILEHKLNKDKAIAFIIPNSSCKMPLKNYIVTIDSVEAVTGIDFFPALLDSIETKLESKIILSQWKLD